MKAGFVTIIGRPNVGKSSLLNMILDRPVSGVSPKPQTTQRQVKGIWNVEDIQVVFVDTPGIYISEKKSHIDLLNFAKDALLDVELVLLLFDPTREFGDEDLSAISLLKNLKTNVFIVFTKIDLVKDNLDIITSDRISKASKELGENLKDTFLISSKTGQGKKYLQKAILEMMPEHDFYFESNDQINIKEIKTLAHELISEACFNHLNEELPYEVKIEVKDVEDEGNIIRINSYIVTKKESQKNIIIGSKGVNISKIGKHARVLIEKSLGRKIFLDLKVR